MKGALSMKKVLLVAEKPSLMRDIRDAYESLGNRKEYDITYVALVGHILELKQPNDYKEEWGLPWRKEVLPMIPEKFEYAVKNGVTDVFDKVRKELLRGYDFVINACDSGREGELIFYSVYNHVGCKLPVKRLWITDQTKETIIKGMQNLIDGKDADLVNLRYTAEFRSRFDWLTGMNFSRAIRMSSGQKIDVGRVMTPVMSLVVKRELEIENFQSKESYEIEAEFEKDSVKFKGIWIAKDGKSVFEDKKEAEKMLEVVKKEKTGFVHSIKQKEERNLAPTMHSLPELQKEANRVFGYSADKTLGIAQTLYEAKLITYPRTDSVCLPESFGLTEIKKHLKPLYKISDYAQYATAITDKRIQDVKDSKKYFDNKKLTDHHAIVTTDVIPDENKLSSEQLNVYNLIAKRFLAIFMDANVVDKTMVVTLVGKELFKSTGSVVKELGYKKLYANEKKKEKEKSEILPPVAKGDTLKVNTLKIATRKSTPPDRYTEATLIQAMEDAGKFLEDKELKQAIKAKGLGTAATRGAIIEKLVTREMIARKKKDIVPTELGRTIYTLLVGKDITSPEMTAKWEVKLSSVEEGELKPKDFYSEMLTYTREKTQEYLAMDKVFKPKGEILEKCTCGQNVRIAEKGYFCENKDCGLIIWKETSGTKISPEEAKKMLKGKEVEKKMKSKEGKEFVGKIAIENGKMVIKYNKSSGTEIGKCPCCGNKVYEREKFYMCEKYSDCKFLIGKEILSTKITKEEAIRLLDGGELNNKRIVWPKAQKADVVRMRIEDGKVVCKK